MKQQGDDAWRTLSKVLEDICFFRPHPRPHLAAFILLSIAEGSPATNRPLTKQSVHVNRQAMQAHASLRLLAPEEQVTVEPCQARFESSRDHGIGANSALAPKAGIAETSAMKGSLRKLPPPKQREFELYDGIIEDRFATVSETKLAELRRNVAGWA